MKMSQFWPKSKAIALVFCSKMTQIEIDGFYLQIEVMKLSQFWPKSKAIALVFCSNMTQIEIDRFYLQIEK